MRSYWIFIKNLMIRKCLMIRTIAQFFIKSMNGKKLTPKTRKIIAQALFPEVFLNRNVLLPANSKYGSFKKALTNAVTSYKKFTQRLENEDA